MILGGGIAIAELDLETVVAVVLVVGLLAMVEAVVVGLPAMVGVGLDVGCTYNLSVDRTVG